MSKDRLLNRESRGGSAEKNGERSAIEKADTANPLGSEELLGFMLDSAKDYAIFTTDVEGCVTSWNAGAERFFGYIEAEILGQNAAILFTPEDREIGAPELELNTAATTGQAEDERWHLRKDGTRFWVSGMVRPHRDDAGQLHGFIKIGRDLTERKLAKDELRKAHDKLERQVEKRTADLSKANGKLQAEINNRERAEQTLIENEKYYRRIVETAQEGIWILDEQAQTNYVNDRMAQILGYTVNEMLGRSMYDFMDDAARIEAEQNFQKRQKGVKERHDFRFRRKDGTDLWAIVSTNPIMNDNNAFTGAVGLVTDITDRKLIEEKLRENEARLTEAQRIARVGSWTFDLGSRAVTWSDEMFNVMGYGLNEIVPTYDVYLNLIHPDDREFVIAAHKQMMRERSGYRHEHRLLFADGTIRFMEANATAVVNRAGKVASVIGTAQDITERRLAEEKLRENEEWLRAIFDASRDGLLVEDDGKIVFINNSYAAILGYDTAEELLGTDVSLMLSPDDSKRMSEYGKARLRGETPPSNYEFKVKRKDGLLVDSEANVATSVIGGKKYIITAVRDITDRKRSEAKIRISEQRFRELVDILPVAVYVCESSSGLIESYNQRAVELWGRTPKLKDTDDCFCGSYKIYGIDGNHLPHAECPMSQVLRTGKAIRNKEIVIERPDGSRRTAVVNILPRLDDQGNLTGAINCLTDITERNQAEIALRQSGANLAAAQRIAHLGSWELDILDIEDASKNPVHCSDEVYRIFGYEPGEIKVTGKVFYGFVHPNDRTRISEALFEAVEQRKDLNIEFPIVLPDGSERILHGQAEVIYDEQSNKPLKFNGTVQDITERKQSEEKLKLSEERLQQSQKMEAIGTLTGGVAHDFNNLLTAILGNTQLALRKLTPDNPIRERLAEVTDAGNRAAELTRKLLAFSRRQHLTRRTININDSIAEIVTLLERIIGEDVEMSVKCDSDLPAVFADAGQIEQVVMNLAVNARDAMPAGGKLTIETGSVELDESYCRQYPYVVPGKYVQIRVSDSGTGMDEETQAHVFEPYFTTKEVGKGTGLGLSMAYGIVKQHDGHINLYSEPGFGTTFKVYLPADKKNIEEKPQAIPISFLGGTETILVAEDEENLRNLAKHTLEDLGYTVLLAKNGEEAVEIFGSHRGRIDLFLSDVIMPRMGGSEAYERIREMGGGNIPLIFMTGYSSETVQSRFVKPKITAEKLGATVIQKPYSLDELGRIVREVLDKNHKP